MEQPSTQSQTEQGFFISIRLKMLIPFTLMFTVVFAAAFYWFYSFATDLAMDNLYNDLIATARAAAAGIDGDMHQALAENPEYDEQAGWPAGMTDERFWQIAEWLLLIHRSNPRAYSYTYISPAPGVVEFITSFGVLLDPPAGAPFGARYEPQPPSVILQGLERETLSTNIVQDEYGAWISGFVPIENASGEIIGAVGIDYDVSTVIALQDRIKAGILPAFAVTYVVLFVAVWLISNGITAPIRALTNSARRIGEGDYHPVQMREGKIRDEVTTLTQVFDLMLDKVREREQTLRNRVAKLQFEIDQVKRERHVEEITESEFFQELLEKAREIRAIRRDDEEMTGAGE